MRVGFLNNQLDNRGTGNAVYDYAHYNEEILGNKSRIYTFKTGAHDPLMVERVTNRFGGFHYIEDSYVVREMWDVDVLYHIKYGNDTWNSVTLPGASYVVHAVFDVSHPHGDRFAAVSAWLADQYQPDLRILQHPKFIEYVPHIVQMPISRYNLREELGISSEAVVFGRYGGFDSFDIPWVWDAIFDTIREDPSIHFLFMNTDIPMYLSHFDQIRSFSATNDSLAKTNFINSCDAMLHARLRGETFGVAVGEFDVLNKPIITYGLSPERAHIENVDQPILYFGPTGLVDILLNWKTIKKARSYNEWPVTYQDYTPEMVMRTFNNVFLK
jgi:hypothetical protein